MVTLSPRTQKAQGSLLWVPLCPLSAPRLPVPRPPHPAVPSQQEHAAFVPTVLSVGQPGLQDHPTGLNALGPLQPLHILGQRHAHHLSPSHVVPAGQSQSPAVGRARPGPHSADAIQTAPAALASSLTGSEQAALRGLTGDPPAVLSAVSQPAASCGVLRPCVGVTDPAARSPTRLPEAAEHQRPSGTWQGRAAGEDGWPAGLEG